MNYIIFDLEATCDENNREFDKEIIEIGAVKISVVEGKPQIVDEFGIFTKPIKNRKLTDFCTKLTTITQEDVDNGVSFREGIKQFQEWIGTEDFLLCSWGFYDRKQLIKDSKRHRLDFKWLDNKHVSLKHQHASITNKKPMGMGKALKFMNAPLDGTHHRGIDDARNIGKIFIHYFDKWEK